MPSTLATSSGKHRKPNIMLETQTTGAHAFLATLKANNIEVLFGSASFVDPNTLRVTNSRGSVDYQAAKIVIATGTKPAGSAVQAQRANRKRCPQLPPPRHPASQCPAQADLNV